jgi:putative sporulation protein YyaC
MKDRISVKHSNATTLIEKCIINQVGSIHKKFTNIHVVCIGSDRATGDSLGPLVGTFLTENKVCKDYIRVQGTLGDTVNATNIYRVTDEIDTYNSLVIAIDASFGSFNSSVGDIIVCDTPLYPGAAVGKDLPPVGDISIIGIVSINMLGMNSEIMRMLPLADTYDMAKAIEKGLRGAIHKITRSKKLRYIGEQLVKEAAVTKG